MATSYAHEFSAMRRAAHAATVVIEKHLADGFKHGFKADHTFVTVADEAAEDAIKKALKKECPEYGYLGEERGAEGPQNARFIIDPIDGTGNFIRDLPSYGPMIGLEIDGEVVAGVLRFTQQRDTYWASKGGGAFHAFDADIGGGRPTTPQRLHVSKASKLSESFFSFDGLFKKWPKHADTFDVFNRACLNSRFYSCLTSQAFVASGRIDFALIPYWQPWDFAAARILVEEAGGRFTNQHGQATIFGKTNYASDYTKPHYADWIIASNGRVHDDVLELLNANLPENFKK
ncbi:Fructose-1,6-bisphosphatase/inositol-1-monophosphatase [uncultured archaeon]|nr:Fructose-1,6-bisphosphatase/inositol-1-monophosphatase [uncultured archaeon]